MANPQEKAKVAPIIIAIEPFGGSLRNHMPQLPLIFFDDAAVTRGDGIFETILLHDGQPINLDRHMQRFQHSARLLDLPEPSQHVWLRATEEAVRQWSALSHEDATCTWAYTRGRVSTGIPSAWLTVSALDTKIYQQREHGLSVITSPRGYSIDTTLASSLAEQQTAPWLAIGAKTLSYAANMAAQRYAIAHGFDDVIYVDGDRVLEATTASVITVRGKKIRTPLAKNGDIMTGTSQAAIFSYAEKHGWNCKLKELDLDYCLNKADSVWLVSSVRGPVRVKRINDKKLPKPDNETAVRTLLNTAIMQA
ncbi:4-amino-4-deoxychorismate lyase [Corynebacterium kutscheri]|uniref:aminodeoxychorismate lyase n=1 Tax=Corynebacterium kutscheri TaxID=35755 RepID=UPI000F70D764|nr:aminodeoxychorismate lyase [Corynebacterium kutscheri]VEH80329.1 4-amino-4-deoxychorismate lyase [Corynebacterium kutscheri]